jgi:hypothetical protein
MEEGEARKLRRTGCKLKRAGMLELLRTPPIRQVLQRPPGDRSR